MKYDLLFEGGGVRGIAFAGALRALEQFHYQPGRLLGVSAGAVVAALVAVGYRSDQILPSLREQLANFDDLPNEFDRETLRNSQLATLLREIDLPLVPERLEQRVDQALLERLLRVPAYRQHFSLVERGGIFAGEKFRTWLLQRFNNMDGLGAATLADLHAHNGSELTVVAADVSDQRLLILNHRTAPDLPLVWAVRMSASIPFFWQEVVWQSEWGLYRGHDLSGHAVVDGGILSSFPLELFVSHDTYVTEIMGEPQAERIIGFLVDEDKPLPNDVQPAPVEYPPTVGRIVRLLDTMLQARDKFVLQAFEDLVVRLPAAGYSALNFNINQQRLQRLVDAAYEETELALRQLDQQAVQPVSTLALWQARYIDHLARRLLRQS